MQGWSSVFVAFALACSGTPPRSEKAPVAKCVAGCCNLTNPMNRWGTSEVMYPKLTLP